jgi:hypothetical protein
MYRLLGIILLIVAGVILVRPGPVASWLGTPVGWQWFWESFRGSGGAGNAVYRGYQGYKIVVGWFWFIVLEAALIGFGLHFALANGW